MTLRRIFGGFSRDLRKEIESISFKIGLSSSTRKITSGDAEGWEIDGDCEGEEIEGDAEGGVFEGEPVGDVEKDGETVGAATGGYVSQ